MLILPAPTCAYSVHKAYSGIKTHPIWKETCTGMTTELWHLLLMNSYIRKEDAPAYLTRLGAVAVRNVTVKGDRGIGFDTNFIDIFPEILSAYGFMLLARDEVRKWQAEVPDNIIHARYHFYAFVFHTKSYLDKVALFLNAQYDLGFKAGSIELRRPEFL